MPQMAPMNWLMLFFTFTLTFLMFNMVNYYSFFYNPKIKNFKKINKSMNWKW